MRQLHDEANKKQKPSIKIRYNNLYYCIQVAVVEGQRPFIDLYQGVETQLKCTNLHVLQRFDIVPLYLKQTRSSKSMCQCKCIALLN